jgi:parallel beta-helix repeat protein
LLRERRWAAGSARVAGVALVAAAGISAATVSMAAAAGPKTLFVSRPHGSNANPCTSSAPCQTINFAVGKARAGDTIIVEKGTYHQFVSVTKRLRIIGIGRPVNDLKGRNNGFNVAGRKAAGTVISGFTVENATFEGIIAVKTSHLTISNNVIKNNDLGLHAKQPTGECAPQGPEPGDCGEGLHLLSVTDSTITGNTLTGNSGGMLLTDEKGPTARNLILRNIAKKNVLDCGITIAGHNPKAAPGGKPAPKVAGIYANTISNNTSNGNGVKGEGAGIIMAGAGPGTAVYNNVVKGNTANDNGIAGVTIHNHAPGQDLNGNKILNNKLSHNGLNDKSEAEFGAADFAKNTTVDILVGSGVDKLTGIVITGNTLSNSHFGIYTKNDAGKVSAKKNTFHNVQVKIKQA